ncbi:MAG: hypothetical protein ACRDRZ_03840 [Pseudonocardiaceae bacterium]
MDALDRADRTLARAQARSHDVVTPDSATSPMDQASTVQIPRCTVAACDPRDLDPESTMVIARDFGPPQHRR